ncbi:MAG: CarD family transcriptional regulator [Sarcina sp.]
MFKVDDHVVYGTTGVCKVTDIVVEKNFKGDMVEYYVLDALFEKSTTAKIPTNNDKIVLRALTPINKINLILNSKDFTSLWIDNERVRHSEFKNLLKQGDLEVWINLARSLRSKKLEKIEASQKLSQADEHILKSAENLLFEELSIVLHKDFSEIKIY